MEPNNALLALGDFIREDENEEYTQALASLLSELTPEGYLENALVEEVMSATWRLRRCRLVQETHILDETTQNALDRARSQAQNALRRSLAELRKLQTERAVRQELAVQLPGVADARHVLAALKARNAMNEKAVEQALDKIDEEVVDEIDAPDSSFCKNAEPSSPPSKPCPGGPSPAPIPASIPRSAPCPCGSGQKYKRCCGRNAPPVLNPGLKIAA